MHATRVLAADLLASFPCSACSAPPLCRCPAGEYQDESGKDACKRCTSGGYCPASSGAPLPCPGGTFGTQSGLATVEECTNADPGSYATTGSLEQTLCPKGSYTSESKQAACEPCEAGAYQDAAGATYCKACPPGFYCLLGASTPMPCPAGTSQASYNASSEQWCSKVGTGFWAPLGSPNPKPCPPSGFYCPGAENDDVNTPPGMLSRWQPFRSQSRLCSHTSLCHPPCASPSIAAALCQARSRSSWKSEGRARPSRCRQSPRR